MSDSNGQSESIFKTLGAYGSEEHDDDHTSQWNKQSMMGDHRPKRKSIDEDNQYSSSTSGFNNDDSRLTYGAAGGSSNIYPKLSTSDSPSLDYIRSEESEKSKSLPSYAPRSLVHFHESNESHDKDAALYGKNNSDDDIRGISSDDFSNNSSRSGRNSSPVYDNKPTSSKPRDRRLLQTNSSSTINRTNSSETGNQIAYIRMQSESVSVNEQDDKHSGDRHRSHGDNETGARERRRRPNDNDNADGRSGSISPFEVVDEKDCGPGATSKPSGSASFDSRHGRNRYEEENYKRGRNNQAGSEPNWKGTALAELITVNKENYERFYTDANKVQFNLSNSKGSGIFDNRFPWVDLPFTSQNPDKNRHDFISWSETKRKLSSCKEFHKFKELEGMIKSYNKGENWDFSALEKFLREHSHYWETVGKMGTLASELKDICNMGIPYLTKNLQIGITFNKKQIASLLCNAFFCTFPGRNPVESYHKPHNRYGRGRAEGSSVDSKPVLPTINFSGLFKEQSDRDESLQGKLHCLFNYFQRVTNEDYNPDGCVTFERRVCKDGDYPDWSNSTKLFTRLHVRKEGFIEDEGAGMLQVDFANKKVGGGVLGRGCVQEEIRFLICPELIISRLFTEELDYNETLLITGCERFSNFSGYARSFKYGGNCKDSTESDTFGRKLTQVVAMDAKSYRNPEDQFRPSAIDRELKKMALPAPIILQVAVRACVKKNKLAYNFTNKAYCGFRSPKSLEEGKEVTKGSKSLEEGKEVTKGSFPAVATGNWGCGAFNGDRHVKALIQLMAAAEAGRDVLYITIDDDQLVNDLFEVHKIFTDKDLTVGNAFNMLKNYATDFHARNFPSNMPKLFDYIKRYNSDVMV